MGEEQKSFTTQQDNTTVVRINPQRILKLTPEQIQEHQQQKFQKALKKNQSYIWDADKIKYYKDLQNFYNQNVFGYGLQGTPTRFDPYTSKGQKAIQSNLNYARGNAVDFLANTSGIKVGPVISKVGNKALQTYSKLTRGVFRIPSKSGALGTLKQYARKPIGGGAEAIVINNTPITVGKMTSIPVEEMMVRNSIPNTVPSKYIGYVGDKGVKLPTYVQRKLKILTEQTFPKYIGKLDAAMGKHGFRKVSDPNVYGRAYTDGTIVIDDISPGNVGLTSGYPWLDKILPDFLKKPKIIDMIYQTVPEWEAMGYKLKKGGKL